MATRADVRVFDVPVNKWAYPPDKPEVYTENREESLKKLFYTLDTNFDGTLDFKELTALVKRTDPKPVGFEHTEEIMERTDTDGDQRVTEEEFMSMMAKVTKDMDDDTFVKFYKDLYYRDHVPMKATETYDHPTGNQEWLSKELLPVMRAGLEALVSHVEKERIHLATHEEFEKTEGYLPDVWSPFCPLKWLAQYMRDHNPKLYFPQPISPKAYFDLTREEKIVMMFEYLDRDDLGYLELKDLLSMAKKLGPEADLAEAKSNFEWMANAEDSRIYLAEWCGAMEFLCSSMDEDDFDDTVQYVLSSSHLSYFTRQEKLQMAFRQLDASKDGVLDLDEIIAFGRTFGGGMDILKAKKTILFMDQDGDRKVSMEEFLVATGSLTNKLSDEKFDAGIWKILNARAALEHGADPLMGVGTKMRRMLTEMPTHGVAKQMCALEAVRYFMEKDDPGAPPLFLVDVRTAEEQAVSTIPGAIKVKETITINDLDVMTTDLSMLSAYIEPGEPDPPEGAATDKKGGKKPPPKKDDKKDKGKPAAGGGGATGPTKVPKNGVVICYDTLGLKGGLAAVALEKSLGLPVYNLCGGIIQWYNEGGEVHNEEGGKVEKVHPLTRVNTGLIRGRVNKFKTKDLDRDDRDRMSTKRRKSRFSNTSKGPRSVATDSRRESQAGEALPGEGAA